LGYALIQNKYVSRDFTVTRATTATRVNSAGLVQLVPYNILQWSESFENTVWLKTLGTLTTNVTTAPNDTLTADLFTKTSAINTVSDVTQLNVFSRVGIYTLSVFIKPFVGNQVLLRIDASNNSCNSTFNFTTKTFTSSGANFISASYEELPNGWFRLFLTGNVEYISWNVSICNLFYNPINDSMYIWGAQLVEGTNALTYLPTTTRLNIPRIDYSTGSPALLIEPQRTNLFIFSEQYDNANWIKADATINVNSTTSPSGIVNADTFIESNTNATHSVSISTTGVLNTFYSITTYVKASGRNFIQFTTGGGFTNLYANINLMDGNINYGTIGVGNVQVTSVGSQWYKISITRQLTASTSISFKLNLIQGINSVIDEAYLGNGVSGVAIWGSQCEAGTYPTSYIPTTSATVTRNADIVAKNAISNFIGQTEGIIFIDTKPLQILLSDGIQRALFNLNENFLSSNLFYLRRVNNDYLLSVNASGVSIASPIIYSYSNTNVDKLKIAIKYNSNSLKVFVNGNNTINLTISAVPTTNNLAIGSNRFNTDMLDGSINSFQLYTIQLTDAECIALTTL
jgi:hypothetical protein